ncbi:MAG: septum formation initiator family protein, partial [Solirubrobacterales bacterium]|nr:septum formation initiator family protein [Solirubrobacterales bacterium]
AEALPRQRQRVQSRQSFRPRHVRSRAPLSRIRWDRASRVVMLGALLIVAWLWIDGFANLASTHAQAAHGLAEVKALAKENHQLKAEAAALHQPATILAKARTLGMVKSGEQAFLLTH